MIGVYGGTFDPVHIGHLRTALEIKEALQLEKVLFVPCGQPSHKNAPIACAEYRSKMLALAIHSVPGFQVDRREFNREGYSYTVDTLVSLRKDYKDKTLCLIVGMDAFLGISHWYRWQSLFDLSHVVVMFRPGSHQKFTEPLECLVKQRQTSTIATLRTKLSGLIFFQQVTQLDISSTRVRCMIRQGYSPRYLIPDKVWTMIREQNVYK